MVDFPLLPSASDLASLRIPDSEEYEYANPRYRSEHGGLTSSSTDPSSPSRARQVPVSTLGQRILAESGAGLIDLIFDIATRTNSTDKQVVIEDMIVSDWTTATNSTNSTYMPDLFYRHSLAMTVVYCIAYLIVFAVGLVGNCFVIAVVYRSPRMRTVTNFFIVNLAIADILVVAFCIPATLTANIFVPWVLGWFMCKTVPYIQGVSVAASVYSLIAVSLDRLLAIWWPMKCQITKRRARIMIFIIWVIALSTTIPWAIYFDLVIFHEVPDVKLCMEVWPNSTNGILYFLIVNLLLFYILPMILISMCYVLIWVKVWKRHIPSDTKDAQIERMQQKSKVKVVKMLVVVVILFVLSWLPLYIIFARIKLGGDIERWEEELLPIATPIAQWLGASNSCINPILYAFFNKKYRRGFVAILKSRRCCGRLRYYETVALMSSSGSSMRKSSYYVNNNSSTRRPPPGQDTSVSYICNNTGI